MDVSLLSSDSASIPQLSPVSGAAPPLSNGILHPAGYKNQSEGACEVQNKLKLPPARRGVT